MDEDNKLTLLERFFERHMIDASIVCLSLLFLFALILGMTIWKKILCHIFFWRGSPS
jgi:hypothetical protein